MKLYPKKLRNVEDLEREKKLLQKGINELDKDDLLSLEGLLGKKGTRDSDDSSGSAWGLLSLLPVSNPILSAGLKAVQAWLSARDSKDRDDERATGYKRSRRKKNKNLIRSLAFEILGGYLKWKGIELSYKGIKHLIKKRKDNKDKEQADA